MAVDEEPDTLWHTERNLKNPPHPHALVIDLGDGLEIAGFTHVPRQRLTSGTIDRHCLETSQDGLLRQMAVEGRCVNALHYRAEQIGWYERKVTTRFVRLIAGDEVQARPWASAAEIGVLLEGAPGPEKEGK